MFLVMNGSLFGNAFVVYCAIFLGRRFSNLRIVLVGGTLPMRSLSITLNPPEYLLVRNL